MKKNLILLFCSFFLASCTTYKTSDSDLAFASVHIKQAPVIPVGDMDTDDKAISFLGWIDVFVQKPNMLEPDATKEQVNYVLAHTAEKRGANAVIHVTYKESLNLTGRKKMYGRGQAVRLSNPLEAEPSTPQPFISAKLAQPTLSEPILAAEANDEAMAVQAPLPSAVAPAIVQTAPIAYTEQEPAAAIIQPRSDAIILTSRKTLIGAQQPPVSEQAFDGLSEQANRMQQMLNSARFLEQKAKAHNDKDMYNATLRLIQMLESQQRFFNNLQ